MTSLEIGRPRRQFGFLKKLLVIVPVGLLIAGAYFLIPKFERQRPQVKLTPDTDAIGLTPIEITIDEQGTGLKSLSVTLTTGGAEVSLVREDYERGVMHKQFTFAAARMKDLKEGPAVLRVSARDRSLWNFFRGNETVVQKNITIDVTPPTLELVADDPYINFGGSGLIVYKPSADTVATGVKIGSYFFPGYKGQVKDPNAYIAFFAHPYNVPPEEKAVLIASDKAGNTRQMKLSYTLKNVKYKKSTIPIDDDFIENKVSPLLTDVGSRQGSHKDIFIKVNHTLRQANDDKIRTVGQKTANKILWQGAFDQLTNSKVEANFADARTYIYQDQAIDTAYHLGFDLSVTKKYPVEAANSGVVSFVGDLGIYGNAVMIDHGLGLSTLYGHLSSIDVKEGESIKKAQIIGKTGETGLAVGDHLHFGVYLHGVPVLPLEWWDEKWLRDNIYPKLESSGTEPLVEAQADLQPKARKVAHRRRR
ncbi:MAG TPA: M23 family metallopeptidase [Candidatus Binatia bacterium]|jgi:murein DD-endopeptidase MepM/ murein hydrolase activator NlpD